jgi:hypothetical protein
VTKSKLRKLGGGFGGIAVFDELGLVEVGFVVLELFGFGLVEVGLGELFAASKAFKRFFASAANLPLGYCCK